jgi:hypothetical protein
MSYHYKSRTAIGRLPLIHIAIGPDESGEKVTPVAVLAVGGHAYGIIAVGAFANGLFSVAWVGVGLIGGFGQFIFGGAVLGQFCAGLVALGQFAVGPFAIGQWALGIWGFGEGGWVYREANWLPGFIRAVDWKNVLIRFEHLAPWVVITIIFSIVGLFLLALLWANLRESVGFLAEWRRPKSEIVEAEILDAEKINQLLEPAKRQKSPMFILNLKIEKGEGSVKKKLVQAVPKRQAAKMVPGHRLKVLYDPEGVDEYKIVFGRRG